MITKVDVHQTLVKAKETFDQRGGAQHRFIDKENKVCAMGALSMFILEYPQLWVRCVNALNNSAVELYGRTIVNVNDSIGYAAAQACYDHAIKSINIDEAE
jgi:hypothetical protein